MPIGTPVNRQWAQVMRDGTFVVDWGDGLYQDIRSGDFLHATEREFSHILRDEELDWLKRIGRIESYDSRTVYFTNLPERPQTTIE